MIVNAKREFRKKLFDCKNLFQETIIRTWECNASIMRGFDEEDRWLLCKEVEGIMIYDTTLMLYMNGEVTNR